MTRQPVFPFVVGAPRSGTTLLRAMLDFHPELFIPRERPFVVEAIVRRRRYERPDPALRSRIAGRAWLARLRERLALGGPLRLLLRRPDR